VRACVRAWEGVAAFQERDRVQSARWVGVGVGIGVLFLMHGGGGGVEVKEKGKWL
jgi:hypothetical protein